MPVSRLAPGQDQQAAWRVPAGEIERIVVGGVVASLQNHAAIGDAAANDVVADLSRRSAMAAALPLDPVPQQRAALLALGVKVQLRAVTIALSFGPSEGMRVAVPARLVRRGSDVRLALPPGNENCSEPDPVLLRLVAHARAAQKMVESSVPHPSVAHYGKRHFWQLLRIGWLAPDIITAIMDGRQPPDLTGRKLLRATNIPLEWAGQRRALGFA